ncbi:hypothetical protein FISHEDRAFT_60654 [Fistulina hepatica ATCC 64428]|uniref:Uncharacterized protein n=1 Tax=Fistulina hepatica ATCC 64428 TaxID=1128425 RepID=A0A0D7A578_9AGAR|nr:hypothetical protein FISHEDRAFT_60654 [Fistulina hepatica ATCC 64428]
MSETETLPLWGPSRLSAESNPENVSMQCIRPPAFPRLDLVLLFETFGDASGNTTESSRRQIVCGGMVTLETWHSFSWSGVFKRERQSMHSPHSNGKHTEEVDDEWQLVGTDWWRTSLDAVMVAHSFSRDDVRSADVCDNDLRLSDDLPGVQCARDVLVLYEALVGFEPKSYLEDRHQATVAARSEVPPDEDDIRFLMQALTNINVQADSPVPTRSRSLSSSSDNDSDRPPSLTDSIFEDSPSTTGSLHRSTSTLSSLDFHEFHGILDTPPPVPHLKLGLPLIVDGSSEDGALSLNGVTSPFVSAYRTEDLTRNTPSPTPTFTFPTLDNGPIDNPPSSKPAIRITKDEQGFYTQVDINPSPADKIVSYSLLQESSRRADEMLPPFLLEPGSRRSRRPQSKTRAIIDKLKSSSAVRVGRHHIIETTVPELDVEQDMDGWIDIKERSTTNHVPKHEPKSMTINEKAERARELFLALQGPRATSVSSPSPTLYPTLVGPVPPQGDASRPKTHRRGGSKSKKRRSVALQPPAPPTSSVSTNSAAVTAKPHSVMYPSPSVASHAYSYAYYPTYMPPVAVVPMPVVPTPPTQSVTLSMSPYGGSYMSMVPVDWYGTPAMATGQQQQPSFSAVAPAFIPATKSVSRMHYSP